MTPREALGAVITILGLLLLLYGLAMGVVHGKIGKAGEVSLDAGAVILGWFLLLIGPAVWFGETPATVKPESSTG